MTRAMDPALVNELEHARARVVAEARRWIGTPYQHLGDVHGVGVDCAMLLIRIFTDTGLIQPMDPRPYSHQWHLHRSEERYLGWLDKVADPTDSPQIGDVIVWQFGRTYSHGGVLVAGDGRSGTVVHALAASREVTIQSVTDAPMHGRPAKWYSVFDRIARVASELGDA